MSAGAFVDQNDGLWGFGTKGKGKGKDKGKEKGKRVLALQDVRQPADKEVAAVEELDDTQALQKVKKTQILLVCMSADLEEARHNLRDTKYWNETLDEELKMEISKIAARVEMCKNLLFKKEVMEIPAMKKFLLETANMIKASGSMLKETKKLNNSCSSVKGD